MKKNRLLSLLLTLVLSMGVLAPMTVARAAESRSTILDDMKVDATAAVLVDTTYGQLDVLYDQDAHERRYPASITKVMTALLTVEAIDNGTLSLDSSITVGPEVKHEVGQDSSTQGIKEGEIMRLEDVLYCALTASANEACNVLAQAVSGNVADFVARMNQRAAELGMTDTHFANTHGYHNENHYTTAYDIAIMCAEAMKHPAFRTIVSSVGYTVPATNLHDVRELHEPRLLRQQEWPGPYLCGLGLRPRAGHHRQQGHDPVLRKQAAAGVGLCQLHPPNRAGLHLFPGRVACDPLQRGQLCGD